MLLKKKQILELKKAVDNINNAKSDDDKKKFLSENIEDVELFLNVLKTVDKKKLNSTKKKTTNLVNIIYKRNEVLDIFTQKSIEDIIHKYSLNELASMYFVIFDSKPISSYNKTRIAKTIYNYIYAMDRASTLLK